MDAIWIYVGLFYLGGILGYQLGYHFGAQRILREWRESLSDREPD